MFFKTHGTTAQPAYILDLTPPPGRRPGLSGAFFAFDPFFFRGVPAHRVHKTRSGCSTCWLDGRSITLSCGLVDSPTATLFPLKKEQTGPNPRKRSIGAGLIGFFISSVSVKNFLSFRYYFLKNVLTFEESCFIG